MLVANFASRNVRMFIVCVYFGRRLAGDNTTGRAGANGLFEHSGLSVEVQISPLQVCIGVWSHKEEQEQFAHQDHAATFANES